ncbi:hypothetical protein SMJ63A_170017 [Stenotrophomonas geniculata]
MASTASSASAVTSCVKPPCVATSRVCARPAGNPSRPCDREPLRGFLNRAGEAFSFPDAKKPKSPAQAGLFWRILPRLALRKRGRRSGLPARCIKGPGPFPGDNRFSRKRISVHSKVLI